MNGRRASDLVSTGTDGVSLWMGGIFPKSALVRHLGKGELGKGAQEIDG